MKKNGKRNGKSVVANVSVGAAQGDPTASSHTRGVKQGNTPGGFERESGVAHAPKGEMEGARGTARRSTSINPGARDPIDPRMPKISPA